MECDKAREAISALIDGEDPGLPDGALAAHLAGCAACRQWQHRAHAVTRRARLGGAFLDHDLAPGVLAAVPPSHARERLRLARRGALIMVALAQLAITVPCLLMGQDHDAGVHAAHELGSFDLALAIAFVIGAIRPALSAGLAWPCGIAAAGLVGTAVADLISGQTIGVDEAQHLIAVLGTALLYWQTRAGGTGSAGLAIGTSQADAGLHRTGLHGTGLHRTGTTPAEPVFRLDGPPNSPGGGAGAARITLPAHAAQPDPQAGAQTGQQADARSDAQSGATRPPAPPGGGHAGGSAEAVA
jgi:predicted anti-sigma-YlaC factor YlaD